MKRLWLAGITLLGVGAAVVLPVTHLRYNDDPADFQFAIVSDRTGGHRAEVFSQAVEKLGRVLSQELHGTHYPIRGFPVCRVRL